MPALIFSPALYLAGTRYELPRPITSFRLLDSWDYARFKVPLLNGDVTAGRSQDGLDVVIDGQIGTQAGLLLPDEAAMFATLEQLRALLTSAADRDLALILYHDGSSGDEHFLKRCSLTRFEYDLSDNHLFTYSLAMHASDPVIYAGVPT